jgi:hypothetical protein
MTEAVRRTLGIAGLVGVAAAIVVGTVAAETLLHDRDAALDQATHYGIAARSARAELLAETGRNEHASFSHDSRRVLTCSRLADISRDVLAARQIHVDD